jgi:hypothetical protein
MVVEKKYWMICFLSINVVVPAMASEHTLLSDGAKYLCTVVLVGKLNKKIESGLPVPTERTRERIVNIIDSFPQEHKNCVSSILPEQKSTASMANNEEHGKQVTYWYWGHSKL